MDWTQQSDIRLGLGFLASILMHGALALMWGHLNAIPGLGQQETSSSQRFKLENLSDSQIKKIRQAGVRGGSKKGFSSPLPPQAQKQAQKQQTQDQPQERISLQDLAPSSGNSSSQNKSAQPRTQEQEASDFRVSNQEVAAQRIARQQQAIQGEVLKELSASNRAREVIQTTGFNLQFEPPEGIPQDELNSVEKIFYSFQKRTFTSYVNTFISNYHQMTLQSSKLKRALQTQSHDLLGRVEFNRKGEAASIRVIEGSPIQEVQNLFEKTLKDLKLPNPPADLLREDGRFVIYYRLKIND